jgi:hypothetical protein
VTRIGRLRSWLAAISRLSMRCRCLPSWATGRGTPARRPECLAAARRLNCLRSNGLGTDGSRVSEPRRAETAVSA